MQKLTKAEIEEGCAKMPIDILRKLAVLQFQVIQNMTDYLEQFEIVWGKGLQGKP